MLDIKDSFKNLKRTLVSSHKFNEKEASEIALQSKVGYSAFRRFEESRRCKADREIYLAARELGFI